MANSLLTINMITREAVRLWRNSNEFIRNIDTQYDDSYAKSGAKIGTTLRIRLPNDFTVRTGAAASIQDTVEQSTTLTLATQKGVDVSYNSVDRTMSLDDFSKRVLAPMVNNLAGHVAADVMGGVDTQGGVANYVANVDGSGNILAPSASTWLQAGASLDNNAASTINRKLVLDPFTQAKTVASLTGLFNPVMRISEQYETGAMGRALGFEWFMDQTVVKHTGGTFSAGGTVNGASQTGTTITVNAITGTLVAGDIVTFASVNMVNRITKVSTGSLRQFVVTAAVATSGTSVSIYPALIPAVSGVEVQYQTVDVSPSNGAAMVLVNPAGVTYRKNIAFAPEAVTLATADLEMPRGVHEVAREQYDGCSMRMVSAYNIMTDQFVTRLDILYGYLYVRPEWAVAVADAV